MAEYLYGTYGELGESTGSVAASSGDVAVICGTAPVNLIRGYASAGIVNRPVKVSDYNDFKSALGTAQDWGKYTLAMVGEAFFNNPMGNLGPIYCVNVLDPDVHRSAGPTVKGLSFVNGKASFASEDIILDSFALEGKTEGTDYEISYNFTDHKVTVKSADADNMLTGTIQASYHTVDVTDIGAGDIVGEETADGQLTGLQSAKLIYQGFNAVPNLYAAPGWSDRPEVYRALCSAATKMNGHWDGFVFADLPTSYEKVTYTAVEAQISDDPHAEGWYEQTGGTYAPSTDTVVNTEDTYYKRTFAEEIDASGDPSAQGYYEADGDGYRPTTDTEVQEGKSYYSVSYDRVTPNAGDDPDTSWRRACTARAAIPMRSAGPPIMSAMWRPWRWTRSRKRSSGRPRTDTRTSGARCSGPRRSGRTAMCMPCRHWRWSRPCVLTTATTGSPTRPAGTRRSRSRASTLARDRRTPGLISTRATP